MWARDHKAAVTGLAVIVVLLGWAIPGAPRDAGSECRRDAGKFLPQVSQDRSIAYAKITFDDNEEGAFATFVQSGGRTLSSFVNVSTDWLEAYGTGVGSYSFQTYVHEIGHALGLGHHKDLVFTHDSNEVDAALQQFLRDADSLAGRFNELSTQMTGVDTETRDTANKTIDQINTLSKQIALVNKQLAAEVKIERQSPELLDQRDRLLKDLSKLVKSFV